MIPCENASAHLQDLLSVESTLNGVGDFAHLLKLRVLLLGELGVAALTAAWAEILQRM